MRPIPTLAALAGLSLIAACSDPAPEPDAADGPDALEDAAAPQQTGEDTARTDAEDEAETAGLPGVDIYIAPLSWVGNIPAIGTLTNATARPGYDNQPAFTEDGTSFYFTSGDSEHTDIWRCSLDCSVRTQITDTPDAGEYSPRPTPAGNALSYIYQAPGGYGGEVWLDDPHGGNARSASGVGPNGYYAFNADMTRLAVFSLDEGFPLKVFGRFEDTEIVTAAEGIGRALYAAPDHDSVYFTLPREDGGFAVFETGFDGAAPEHRFDLPGETQDYAVFTLPDGTDGFFAVDQNVLMTRTLDAPWHSVADLAVHDIDGVTRLAVSPDRRHIALVANDPAGE